MTDAPDDHEWFARHYQRILGGLRDGTVDACPHVRDGGAAGWTADVGASAAWCASCRPCGPVVALEQRRCDLCATGQAAGWLYTAGASGEQRVLLAAVCDACEHAREPAQHPAAGPDLRTDVRRDAAALVRCSATADSEAMIVVMDCMPAPRQTAAVLAAACVTICRHAGIDPAAIAEELGPVSATASSRVLAEHWPWPEEPWL